MGGPHHHGMTAPGGHCAMSSIIAARWLGGATLGSSLSTANADKSGAMPLYPRGRGSPDGIRKFYQGREMAAVMGFEGASWLERPSRASEERPDLLVKELRLLPGTTVADIGAGSGYFSGTMGPILSPDRVFA